jgi:hypothetical protein
MDQKSKQKTSRHGGRDDRSPNPLPVPGHFLLAGIDAVLPRLMPPAPPVPQLVDDLRVALARTAACGETCQVAIAADDVRLATKLLLAGSIDEACHTLRRARTVLVDPARHPPLT